MSNESYVAIWKEIALKKDHITKHFPEFSWTDARKEFDSYYRENQIVLDEAGDALVNLLHLLLKNEIEPTPKVTGRVKDFDECIKKFELKYLPDLEKTGEIYHIKDHISDLVGLRVICIYESDIEKVALSLRKNLEVLGETDKSSALEIHENQFGYKGLHLDAKLNADRSSLPEYVRFSDLKFEIQVRSIVQDAWSEVDHRLKYKKRIPTDLKRRINRLAAIFELADQEFEAIRDNTSKLEKLGRESSTKSKKDSVLTPFNFEPLALKYFQDYEFEPYKIDGFVDDLLQQNENMTIGDLENALKSHLPKVQKYVQYLGDLGHKMNPFTQIRHCLYSQNKVLYLNLMRVGPMKNFDRWLEYGTVHPSEIPIKWWTLLVLAIIRIFHFRL